ncbi:MAG: hypothetical protein JWN59_1071 [Sphingomonas bacterium]|nr:hypothetical protein [Sphingomonas bacterium]
MVGIEPASPATSPFVLLRRAARSGLPVLVGMSLLLGAAGCKKLEPKGANSEMSSAELTAERDRIRRGCASEITYQRLKELAFDEARRIRNAESANLERLAAASVIRMEEPLVKSRDDKLNVTVCTGRLILELPAGSEAAFGGERRLSANVEYAAQAAADGSGLVYQMDGAEPIIYRLAAFEMRGGLPGRPPLPQPLAVTELAPPPEPDSATAAEPDEEEEERPQPARRPAPTVVEIDERDEAIPPPAPVRAARPSFNCRYARSRVEKMICTDDRLAAQDRRMAASFYAALAAARGGERAELQRSRNAFVAARDRCRSEECVSRSYDERIAELRDWAGTD